MLVIHGFWLPEPGLCLWAEDSELIVKSRSQAYRSARPHPFAAEPGALDGTYAGKAGDATLLLPSVRSAPLDSPELVRKTPRPPAQSRPALLPWTVPVVCLDPTSALIALSERASGLRYGASISYLADLAAFAGELVSRGRLIPALAADADGAVATWRPVLSGPDVVTMHALTKAMPPVCRAVPGQGDPVELVTATLAAMVDTIARGVLSAGPDLVPARRGRRPERLPAIEAWLEALARPEGRFAADPAELDALAEELAAWADVGSGRSGPARATFRLSDANADADPNANANTNADSQDQDAAGGQWVLEFLLQSESDPSLLVPAAQAWSDDGSLRRWLANPRELLLTELGRASRIYPELADGLRQRNPCGLELDADGAYRFLSAIAPALDEAGFGVLLPSWWDRRAKLGLTASAHTPVDGVVDKASKFGKDQLMDFRWQLAVGDDTLTDAEIAMLAEAKAPLIRLRGQWVAVDPEQLKRGIEFLTRNQQSSAGKSAAEILALAAAHPDDLDTPLPVTTVTADGWLGELLNGGVPQFLQSASVSEHFRATLRPYQQRGLSWLSFLASLGLGACLADDMGLGKTVQLLALETAYRADDPAAGPTLLLCPMSLVGNWEREAAKFAPRLRVYAHHGSQRLHGHDLADRLTEVDLALTTYATATRDIDELAGTHWNRVVLDEAQAIKNSLSQAAKAVKRLGANHRVALTGTPVENRLAELWSIMDFLNPGLLGSSERFRARYSIPVERHGQTEPARRLRAVTRPYVLRRLKTDPAVIDDLPDKIEIKQYCQLTGEQASLYQAVVDDMMEKIDSTDGIERRGNVLAAMAKLKQVCDHPALLLHDRSAIGSRSGKVIRLEEILEEILAEGDKVLCFTQYTEFAEMLLPHLSARFGTNVGYLHGGTPRARRDQLVTDFQEENGAPVFLLSLKAGGTGLNLTAANHVIHLDRWWNPAVENQATDRAFRIGQKRNVQVRKFICTGTLEEKIDEMIEEKKALADLVISDGESWLTELSTEDLRQVFALSKDAVSE
ncbi:MAG TPA: DEAD/DEAH box helicase [Streptosporangiaceae bacterium]|jgi:SNF2 family DNA or RNA helicase|nr:DEAD/DEAH box helicase [Streptosporangiaceae bacterium]